MRIFLFVFLIVIQALIALKHGCVSMKKINRFHGNSNNAYSLNYKFDSISPAGKCNGTALDLIKRYNDLAKEAHSGGNFVEMEIFRQYAEHYRKIVTEVNDRRGYRLENVTQSENKSAPMPVYVASVENTTQQPSAEDISPVDELALKPAQKAFKVIELALQDTELPEDPIVAPKPKRASRKKITVDSLTEEG